MCQKKYPKLVSNSFFLPYPYPLDTSQFLQHYSVEGTLIIGGEEIWRWELHHLETWSRGGFSKLLQPRGSTSFGCSRCSFTAGGPARIWRLWAGVEGNWLTRSTAQGSLACTSSPAPSALRQSIQGTLACPDFRGVAAAQVTKAWREYSQHSLFVESILFSNLYFVMM